MNFKTNHLKFSLKLILNQSAVLVEYPGHEPQLFMPTLFKDSIVLRNIIFDHITQPDNETPKHTLPHKSRSEAGAARPKRKLARNSSACDDFSVKGITVSKSFKWARSAAQNNGKPLSPNKECSEWMRPFDNTDKKAVLPNSGSSKLVESAYSCNSRPLNTKNNCFQWVRSGNPDDRGSLNSEVKKLHSKVAGRLTTRR
ncbi:uncharacterized protein LOC111597230 [Drosophila hydei]|uniref:Uncharacterized protein LOC111597230 n=1 Tax=Drosophila hydei TaxID=7224 RepID=A0A6J1LUN0_DROHY|nr:uncharacterized protein LOC111597230 [Drosophila hydei]